MPSEEFREPLPDDCPPPSAKLTDGRHAWRAVASDPPSKDDFASEMARTPNRFARSNNGTICKARGVSLFEDKEEARKVCLLRKKEHLKYLAEIELVKSSGKFQRRRKNSHITWWPYKSAKPCNYVITLENA